MTLADLGHKSIRRNALIADLLRRIDFIEMAGTGIRRIRQEARAGGFPEPRFEGPGFVTATFFPNPEVRARSAPPAGIEATEQVCIDPPFATGADLSLTAPIVESGEQVFKEQSVI